MKLHIRDFYKCLNPDFLEKNIKQTVEKQSKKETNGLMSLHLYVFLICFVCSVLTEMRFG